MRLGVKVPNTGPVPSTTAIGEVSAMLESLGWDSLWVSDHVVLPERVASPYPFAPDRRVDWSTAVDWYDVVVCLAQMAACTRRASLGVAVLVLPLRNPVEFAKQIASIVAQPHGDRLLLGVGVGWLAEEFEALNVPFDSRGARFDEWLTIIRDCRTGHPEPFEGAHYRLPSGALCLPSLSHPVPFLVGGNSPRALRRAGRTADGWLGHFRASEINPEEIAGMVQSVRGETRLAGRDPADVDIVVRVVQTEAAPTEFLRQLPALARAGVGEIIVDVDWNTGDDRRAAAACLERYRDATG